MGSFVSKYFIFKQREAKCIKIVKKAVIFFISIGERGIWWYNKYIFVLKGRFLWNGKKVRL